MVHSPPSPVVPGSLNLAASKANGDEDISDLPFPIFLGVCQRSQRRGLAVDLLGVSPVAPTVLFPCRIDGLQMVLALPSVAVNISFKLHVSAINESKPEEKAWFDLSPHQGSALAEMQADISPRYTEMIAFDEGEQGLKLRESFQLLTVPCPPLVLTEPAWVRLEVSFMGRTSSVGRFFCPYAQPPPISEEERRAIMSRPGACKRLSVQLSCKKCEDSLWIETMLDPADKEKPRQEKAIWLDDAPDLWTCKCDRTKIPTRYLKQGLHDLFRRNGGKTGPLPLDMTRLYEKGAIAKILDDFQGLLVSEHPEEVLQKFIENHPIIWAFLSPTQILHKPCILTKKKADFGVLTSSKILYLIEIEKPNTKLAKKKGGIHAELQSGLDQLRDWHVTVTNHRSALLDELGFKDDEVHDIRFILIAGLAHKTSSRSLITLRRNRFAEGEFYCFDELCSFLNRLSGELESL